MSLRMQPFFDEQLHACRHQLSELPALMISRVLVRLPFVQRTIGAVAELNTKPFAAVKFDRIQIKLDKDFNLIQIKLNKDFNLIQPTRSIRQYPSTQNLEYVQQTAFRFGCRIDLSNGFICTWAF